MDSLATAQLPLPSLGSSPEALAAPIRPGDGRSMDAVATNFESLLLSLMIKQMRQTLEPEGLFPQDSGDVMGGLFDLYMGQHLAQVGGVGIGTMLRRQLEKTHGA